MSGTIGGRLGINPGSALVAHEAVLAVSGHCEGEVVGEPKLYLWHVPS